MSILVGEKYVKIQMELNASQITAQWGPRLEKSRPRMLLVISFIASQKDFQFMVVYCF